MTDNELLSAINEKLDRLIELLVRGDRRGRQDQDDQETFAVNWLLHDPVDLPRAPRRFQPFSIPNPEIADRQGCAKCGMTFQGVSGYACAQPDCGMGFTAAGE